MKQKARKRITAYLLSLVMILGMIPLLPAQTYALSSQGDTILTFTSDAHNEQGNESADRVGPWIESVNKYVSEDENATTGIDLMTFCGDMGISAGENSTDGKGSLSQDTYWSLAKKVMDAAEEKLPGKVAYTTGNHEYEDGGYDYSKYGSYGDGQIQSKFKIDEVVASGDNYEVYVMGCRSRSQSYDSAQVSALETYLNKASSNKIYFIASHYPLHSIGSRTTSNADSVVTTLNNVITQKNLKVVFIWGHNHSQNDSMYTKVLVPGQTSASSLQINNSTTRTVNFYYIPAGCMSDTENQTGGPNRSEGASWIKAKGVMFRIPADNSTASFGKFDREGKLIDSQETLLDTSEWDSDFVAADRVEISNDTLTLEVDESKQLTAAVKPDNATNQKITWSSNKENIATVDSEGNVTGVEEGICTITAKEAKSGKSAYCTVTVNAKSVTPDPDPGPGPDPDPDPDPGTDPDPAVNPQPADSTAEVNTAKQTATKQLDAAKSQANLAQYKDEQKVAIINLVYDYEKKISAAKTKAEVDKLMTEFKDKVNALPKASSSSNNAATNTANTVKSTGLTLKSLKAGKKQLTVKWTANAKVFDGYEVSYRIKGKKWKTTKVAGASKSSKVIKKLKKGKKYQVRIRGYKNVSGTTVFGKYSKTKTKKVK